MGLFFGKRHRSAAAQQQAEDCRNYLEQTENAMAELMKAFTDRDRYLEPEEADRWTAAHAELLSEKTLDAIVRLRRAEGYSRLAAQYCELLQCAKILRPEIEKHNEMLARSRAEQARQQIGPVEGHTLDSQQMECLVKDVHSHLVLAGAGTGKTTTILGRIKYLLASGQCDPGEILVLSYTNASASEMRDRIAAETGASVQASTFHSLGLSVVRQVTGGMPKITQLNLKQFIRDEMEQQLENPSYMELLVQNQLYYRLPAKSEFEFRTARAYREYLACYPPKTVRNEIVGSYAEMDIANFLTEKGITYRYEAPYVEEQRISEFGTYCPSFYLPDYGIYIEYFPLNRAGCFPRWFTGKETTGCHSPRWIRRTHEYNHTAMLECCSYEKTEGTMLYSLEQKLRSCGVPCESVEPAALWERIRADGGAALDRTADLIETLINLLKSNQETLQSFRDRIRRSDRITEDSLAFALLCPIYQAYCKKLSQNGEIDFSDMINLATAAIRSGRWVHPYRHIIVDEYQDISRSRYRMLQEMRRSRDYSLFCVGDDWQSIYRFAGSDVGFILNFEKYWGPSEISRIETTYRFPQSLIETSGAFIMRNPLQMQKSMRGLGEDPGSTVVIVRGQTEKKALEQVLVQLRKLPQKASVFLIGRYSFDLQILQGHPKLRTEKADASGFPVVHYDKRPDLQMHFLTAHRSKGLQADCVVILNNRNGKMGFPSRVQEPHVLTLLLDSMDEYPFAEERRLFYVAMTRARMRVYLMAVKGEESEFLRELETPGPAENPDGSAERIGTD